jgi:hypothetical protein
VREESLASVQVATFVELPPARQEVMCGGSGVCGKSGEEGFWGKVGRQVGDAKVSVFVADEVHRLNDTLPPCRTCLNSSSILSRVS